MKKHLAILLALTLLVGLFAGCGSNAATQAPAEPAEEADDENYDTGDASLDDPLNADGIGENELLVVSFGTSFNDSRRETIGAIEAAMTEAFPEWSVRRGFTSQIIIDHVYRRDGEKIDSVTEALDRAVANGVKTLIVQPTHLMNGFEYNDVVDEVAQYADAFEKIAIGDPVLSHEKDFYAVAEAIVDATKQYDDGQTAIVFMGHGTRASSNVVYQTMQHTLADLGMKNYFIGTVEAEPSVEDVLAQIRAGSYTKVVLEPLMIVAGDHANNDMAGDDEDSWKSIFEAAGYEVECVLKGLGSFPAIQELLVSHARAAWNSVFKVAGAGDMTTVEEVAEAGMVPVGADGLRDGTYPVEMKSSSSMFKVDRCELVVADGKIEAVLYMASDSYAYMFPGTAVEAAMAEAAGYDPLIPLEEHADGSRSFTLEITALDEPFTCAAHSRRKELWYDRTLLFRADSLPAEAFKEGFFTTAERLGLSDGEYAVEVSLSGGSGRASVTSPAKLTVANGVCAALIEWSSKNYDYMRLDDEIYLPVNAEGNSAFEIPVEYFDRAFTVYADTTAMSQPHEIEYTLTFNSATIQVVG